VTVRLRLFAQARDAAGRAVDELDAPTLGELLDAARARYGPAFAAVLGTARVWVNGDEPADGDATRLGDGDEVAVLPPVSGGARREGGPTAT
jgi:sulfur-carrier protein